MKAKEIIKTLQSNLEKEVVLQECKRYEDNIPMIEIHSVDTGIVGEDDDEREVVFINFITTSKEDYWKQRCLLAEDIIQEISIEEIVENDIDAKEALNSYNTFIKS